MSLDAVPDAFETARLDAERLAAHHLPELIRFHRDAEVMAELGGVRDEQQTAAYMARNLAHWREHGFGVWILRERGETQLAGRAILRHLAVDDVDEIEIGYALTRSLWGRGLGTEIGEACVSLARSSLGVTSLVGVTTRANYASQRVLLKLGFEYAGEMTIEETICCLYRNRAEAPAGP